MSSIYAFIACSRFISHLAWGTEKFSSLSKVAQLVRGRTSVGTWQRTRSWLLHRIGSAYWFLDHHTCHLEQLEFQGPGGCSKPAGWGTCVLAQQCADSSCYSTCKTLCSLHTGRAKGLTGALLGGSPCPPALSSWPTLALVGTAIPDTLPSKNQRFDTTAQQWRAWDKSPSLSAGVTCGSPLSAG